MYTINFQKFFYQLQTSLRRFTPYEEIIYTTVYIIISVAAVIGNGLVIMAVVRKKTMRTNRNVLILNLALSNLVSKTFSYIEFVFCLYVSFPDTRHHQHPISMASVN